MPYINVLLHYVWSTKYRKPILVEEPRELLFKHMKEYASSKDIYIDRINGYLEHVHCLVSMKSVQTLDQIAKCLKGESAHWMNNKSGLKNIKLQWQEEYYVASVSESGADKVRAYIDNQVVHHQRKTFAEEYEEIIKKFGLMKS